VTPFADEELDRGLAHDSGINALEPVVEEAQLVGPPFLGVERVVMRTGMNAQLLVL